MNPRNRPRAAAELHPGGCQKHLLQERYESIRPRMNKFWKRGEKILGSGEGRVQHRGPEEGLPRTLESVCVMGEDSCCTREKLLVEVDHPQEPLESRIVRRQRKGTDGGGVLG